MLTNPKLASIDPLRWATFRGITLLFDNSDAGLPSPGVAFYDQLAAFLDSRHAALAACQLGRLPRPSYHVTLLDGVNDGNIHRLTSHRAALQRLLDGLPDALHAGHPLRQAAAPFLDLFRLEPTAPVQLSFDALEVWGTAAAVLVARLLLDTPGRELAARRGRLNAQIAATFGIQAQPAYTPHVSLGYFANAAGAQQARAQLAGWNAAVATLLEGQQLRFDSASLYGFTRLDGYVRALPLSTVLPHAEGGRGHLQGDRA